MRPLQAVARRLPQMLSADSYWPPVAAADQVDFALAPARFATR